MRDRPLGIAAALTLAKRGAALKLGLAAAALFVALALVAFLLTGWWTASSAGASQPCGEGSGDVTRLADGSAPPELVPLFEGAARRYRHGPRAPAILRGIAQVEPRFG